MYDHRCKIYKVARRLNDLRYKFVPRLELAKELDEKKEARRLRKEKEKETQTQLGGEIWMKYCFTGDLMDPEYEEQKQEDEGVAAAESGGQNPGMSREDEIKMQIRSPKEELSRIRDDGK